MYLLVCKDCFTEHPGSYLELQKNTDQNEITFKLETVLGKVPSARQLINLLDSQLLFKPPSCGEAYRPNFNDSRCCQTRLTSYAFLLISKPVFVEQTT